MLNVLIFKYFIFHCDMFGVDTQIVPQSEIWTILICDWARSQRHDLEVIKTVSGGWIIYIVIEKNNFNIYREMIFYLVFTILKIAFSFYCLVLGNQSLRNIAMPWKCHIIPLTLCYLVWKRRIYNTLDTILWKINERIKLHFVACQILNTR